MSDTDPNPGDEAAPGTPGTGEVQPPVHPPDEPRLRLNCPHCKGAGEHDGVRCPVCGGSGRVIEG